jgi:hypothetical protein
MKAAQVNCANCNKQLIFAEDPYNTPGATKYWSSTYDEIDKPLFIVQRQTPSTNRKGKMTVRVTNEYITAVYCDAKCGVEYGNREKVSSGND